MQQAMRIRKGRGARGIASDDAIPQALPVEFLQLRDSKGGVCTGCTARYDAGDLAEAERHATGRCQVVTV